jgi:hypothetical protein
MSALIDHLDAIEGRIARDDDRIIEEWRERWPEKAALVAALRAVVELCDESDEREFGAHWQLIDAIRSVITAALESA